MKYSGKILVFLIGFISLQIFANEKIQEANNMQASGKFDVQLVPQTEDTSPAGRMTIHKTYTGNLAGTGTGQMISKRTEGTSVYSAIEEFSGELNGKKGSFTLFHTGTMSSSQQELKVIIVEGSGSNELKTITGELTITQDNGVHTYLLDYTL